MFQGEGDILPFPAERAHSPQVLLGEGLALGDHGLLGCPSLLVGVDALLVGVDALLVGVDARTLQGVDRLSCVHASLLAVLGNHLDNGVR